MRWGVLPFSRAAWLALSLPRISPSRSIFPGILSDNPSTIPTTDQDHGGPGSPSCVSGVEQERHNLLTRGCVSGVAQERHNLLTRGCVSGVAQESHSLLTREKQPRGEGVGKIWRGSRGALIGPERFFRKRAPPPPGKESLLLGPFLRLCALSGLPCVPCWKVREAKCCLGFPRPSLGFLWNRCGIPLGCRCVLTAI
jgi:hypothetical protein